MSMLTEQELNQLTHSIIEIAIEVHRELGPGLLEKVYQTCLRIALEDAGYQVQSEISMPVFFRGQLIETEGYRIDLLVDNTVVIEIKSVLELNSTHLKQLITYLKLSDKPCGQLLNFNTAKLTDGIKRAKNGYSTSP